MDTLRSRLMAVVIVTTSILAMSLVNHASAATADDLEKDSRQALQTLYQTNALAEQLADNARAILVFPNVIKAGLVFGGSYGEGVLFKDSKVVDYYNSVAATWGFQAGAQSYSYVVFLMTEQAVQYIEETHGWELGVGPTLVLVDEGVAKNLSTSTTFKDDAYAFVFSQQGLMAGVSIEGTKISKIQR